MFVLDCTSTATESMSTANPSTYSSSSTAIESETSVSTTKQRDTTFSTRVDTSTVSSTTLTSPTTSTVQDSTSETTTTGDEATDKQTTQDKAFSEVARSHRYSWCCCYCNCCHSWIHAETNDYEKVSNESACLILFFDIKWERLRYFLLCFKHTGNLVAFRKNNEHSTLEKSMKDDLNPNRDRTMANRGNFNADLLHFYSSADKFSRPPSETSTRMLSPHQDFRKIYNQNHLDQLFSAKWYLDSQM